MQRAFALVLAACLSVVGTAHADDGPPPERRGVYWRDEWRRVAVWEVMISAALTARNVDLGNHLYGPEDATIEFEVPIIDPGGRALLRADSPGRRAGAKRLSDLGLRVMAFAPYVVDVGLGALAIHRNPDVAAQLALIDFEVLTLAGTTQLVLSRLIGRARPYVQDCTSPETCLHGPYRSFLSGHAMGAFTAAGLMCVHHEKLPLFGGGAPDTWACVWAVSVASLTSALRVVADEHWTSDVLLGAALGWGYGYFLPKLLHFHAAKATKKADGRPRAVTWMPTFAGTPQSGLLGVAGTF